MPGVPGMMAAPAEAAAAAAFAFALLRGLVGVAAGVDGVPCGATEGLKRADVGAPIGVMPDGSGAPLGPVGGFADVEANGGAGPKGAPGTDAYTMGGPRCGDGVGRPLDPAGDMGIDAA